MPGTLPLARIGTERHERRSCDKARSLKAFHTSSVAMSAETTVRPKNAADPHEPWVGPIGSPSIAALYAAGSEGAAPILQASVLIEQQDGAEGAGQLRLHHLHHLGERLLEGRAARDGLEDAVVPEERVFGSTALGRGIGRVERAAPAFPGLTERFERGVCRGLGVRARGDVLRDPDHTDDRAVRLSQTTDPRIEPESRAVVTHVLALAVPVATVEHRPDQRRDIGSRTRGETIDQRASADRLGAHTEYAGGAVVPVGDQALAVRDHDRIADRRDDQGRKCGGPARRRGRSRRMHRLWDRGRCRPWLVAIGRV